MDSCKWLEKLQTRNPSISLAKVADNSKASSGGERDRNFLTYLVDSKLLRHTEKVLKRTNLNVGEEYFLERYKKMDAESDRHFLCRTVIQYELKKLGIETFCGIDMGNMDILRSNCNYDIVTSMYDCLIDIGLTPARNYFRGLSDTRVKAYMITSYFDDYMDDIIFSVFIREKDKEFMDALADYEEGFKNYVPPADSELDKINLQY